MAVGTATLRIAIAASNQIMLWLVYGRDRVAREHLSITRVKPRLVVSNGDVLEGKGFYHYLMGVGIWFPLAIGLLLLIYYTLFPKLHRDVFQVSREQSVNLIALFWALALFFLVTGLLPFWPAMAVAAGSVVVALIWVRSIPYDDRGWS
jgi:hypothetical protein